MESFRSEMIRTYIRAPPNRTACDCCFDFGKKSCSMRSDCKTSSKSFGVRKEESTRSSFSSTSSEAPFVQYKKHSSHTQDSQKLGSNSASSTMFGRFNRNQFTHPPDDPPPPYSPPSRSSSSWFPSTFSTSCSTLVSSSSSSKSRTSASKGRDCPDSRSYLPSSLFHSQGKSRPQ